MERDEDWDWFDCLPGVDEFEEICATDRAVLLEYEGRRFWCPARIWEAWTDGEEWAERWAERKLKPIAEDGKRIGRRQRSHGRVRHGNEDPHNPFAGRRRKRQ